MEIVSVGAGENPVDSTKVRTGIGRQSTMCGKRR
jgi:hypothetical protein